MRCPICGSKIIYEAIDHKHFSGGKAVAGAVLFGVVGAAAGFVGKDKKGYKCGACGAFSENTMDMNTEFAVNKAVRTAEDDGDFTSYNLYKKTYPNIEAVNSEQKRNNHSTKVEAALENDASDSISKNIYKNTKYDVKCPVFVEEVIIKTVNGSDVLSLLAWNHSDKTLRSVYFEIKILDDVGDLINETKCVYQGLAISPGEKLPLETEFALNTNIAYKVDFRCTKAAFNDDTVWRDSGQDYKELVIPTMLQPEDFPKYKAFKQKFCEKTSLNEDVDVYQPVFAEEYTQCICGFPFEINSKCAHCGLNVEDIANIISFENLVEFERQNIIKIAESRFNAVKSIFEKSKDGALEQAKSLMPADDNDDYEYAIICYEEALEALAKIPGWKDADELTNICNDKINEIKAAQEAERLEAERLAEVERQESEKKTKRNKKITIIATPIVCAIIAFIIVLNTLIIPNSKYNDAIALMDASKYDEAIITFQEVINYKNSTDMINECKYRKALTLMVNGEEVAAAKIFRELGDYKESNDKYLSFITPKIKKNDIHNNISIYVDYIVGIKSDGTVVAVGDNRYDECEVRDWTDIVAVCSGDMKTLGVKSDGTLINTGKYQHYSEWKNIIAIYNDLFHTVGLKSDGTVVVSGYSSYSQDDVSGWTDIVAIDAADSYIVGLKSNGTVIAVGDNDYGQCDVSGWTDIVAIYADRMHTIGLKSDGTVVATGDNSHGQCDVRGWDGIVEISAGYTHTVGLKYDGTVVATGYNEYGQCDVSGWTDIVAVYADYDCTVGLKSDGTVVAAGNNRYGQCDVSGWTDIVAVYAENHVVIGLKSDGTIVAVGDNRYGQCDVRDWKNIKLPKSN